mmetsp:Transcript_21924/g.70784  ORF Transcript_21924/g.70784 Transcript_21924/m.70784 type:complete len:469 (+) Transcript_21924:195-1601(+)
MLVMRAYACAQEHYERGGEGAVHCHLGAGARVIRRPSSPAFFGVRRPLRRCKWAWAHAIAPARGALLDERVQKDAADADAAPDHLEGLERLAEREGDSDDDDDALGGVGHRLGRGRGLLDGEGRELVVQVKVEAGGDQVGGQGLAGLEQLDESAETLGLEDQPERQEGDGAKDRRECELIAGGPDAVPESWCIHQLFVLVGAECGENVGDTRREESPHGEIELLERGEANATDDRDQAQPLVHGQRLPIQANANGSSKCWLRGLDDLGEGDGAEVHREDGREMSTRRARCHREDIQQVLRGDVGERTHVWGSPGEERVNGADDHLQEANGDREAVLGATRRSQCELIIEGVEVVADVPSQKVQNELVVNTPGLAASDGKLLGLALGPRLAGGHRRTGITAAQTECWARRHNRSATGDGECSADCKGEARHEVCRRSCEPTSARVLRGSARRFTRGRGPSLLRRAVDGA